MKAKKTTKVLPKGKDNVKTEEVEYTIDEKAEAIHIDDLETTQTIVCYVTQNEVEHDPIKKTNKTKEVESVRHFTGGFVKAIEDFNENGYSASRGIRVLGVLQEEKTEVIDIYFPEDEK